MNSFIKKIILVLSTICVYVSVFADDHKIATDSDGRIVAVGINGIYSSLNAINWSQRLSVEYRLNSVTYGADKFVTVGDKGTIWYSSDGEHWKHGKGLSGEYRLNSVTYGAGKFVAVGDKGVIWYSSDGEYWKYGKGLSGEYRLNSVTYGAGKFVAVGGDIIVYSSDAINWSQRLSGYGSLNSVTYAAGKFVAVGGYEQYFYFRGSVTAIVYSSDGELWYPAKFLGDKGGSLNSLTYAAGKFVAVGAHNIFYSSDASNWDLGKGWSFDTSFDSVTYGAGKFVVLSTVIKLSRPLVQDLQNTIFYSYDAGYWKQVNDLSWSIIFNSVTYAAGKFVAVGNNFFGYSSNAMKWDMGTKE